MTAPQASGDPLQGLRDIHLPGALDVWPPAPGWWGVAIVLLITAGVLVWQAWRRYRRRAFLREALLELDMLEQSRQGRDDLAQLEALAALVRRVAITRFGRHEVAGHTGDAWLRFLDRSGQTQAFTQGPGRMFGAGRYQRDPVVDTAALAQVCRDWIRRQRC